MKIELILEGYFFFISKWYTLVLLKLVARKSALQLQVNKCKVYTFSCPAGELSSSLKEEHVYG